MKQQSAVTQNLYSQLHDEATAYAAIIFEQGIIGSPYLNKADGKEYWYWQARRPDGILRTMSLGRNTPEIQAVVASLVERKNTAAEAVNSLKITTRAYVASGGMSAESAHFKIIEILARTGIFSKGLVVVGSHAFAAIGNMLGVRWSSSLKTTDMDFARASGIAVAIPDSGGKIDIPTSIKVDDPSFFLVPELNNRQPSTSMMSNKTKVKIDFLTTQRNSIDSEPHYYADLNIAATPLRFMDYLVGKNVQRGLIVGSFAIPVNVPDPARFAIHKLVIAQERTVAAQTKSAKDIRQATEVIAALVDIGREFDIHAAITDIILCGKKALANLNKSLARMEEPARGILHDELQRALMSGIASGGL